MTTTTPLYRIVLQVDKIDRSIDVVAAAVYASKVVNQPSLANRDGGSWGKDVDAFRYDM